MESRVELPLPSPGSPSAPKSTLTIGDHLLSPSRSDSEEDDLVVTPTRPMRLLSKSESGLHIALVATDDALSTFSDLSSEGGTVRLQRSRAPSIRSTNLPSSPVSISGSINKPPLAPGRGQRRGPKASPFTPGFWDPAPEVGASAPPPPPPRPESFEPTSNNTEVPPSPSSRSVGSASGAPPPPPPRPDSFGVLAPSQPFKVVTAATPPLTTSVVEHAPNTKHSVSTPSSTTTTTTTTAATTAATTSSSPSTPEVSPGQGVTSAPSSKGRATPPTPPPSSAKPPVAAKKLPPPLPPKPAGVAPSSSTSSLTPKLDSPSSTSRHHSRSSSVGSTSSNRTSSSASSASTIGRMNQRNDSLTSLDMFHHHNHPNHHHNDGRSEASGRSFPVAQAIRQTTDPVLLDDMTSIHSVPATLAAVLHRRGSGGGNKDEDNSSINANMDRAPSRLTGHTGHMMSLDGGSTSTGRHSDMSLSRAHPAHLSSNTSGPPVTLASSSAVVFLDHPVVATTTAFPPSPRSSSSSSSQEEADSDGARSASPPHPNSLPPSDIDDSEAEVSSHPVRRDSGSSLTPRRSSRARAAALARSQSARSILSQLSSSSDEADNLDLRSTMSSSSDSSSGSGPDQSPRGARPMYSSASGDLRAYVHNRSPSATLLHNRVLGHTKTSSFVSISGLLPENSSRSSSPIPMTAWGDSSPPPPQPQHEDPDVVLAAAGAQHLFRGIYQALAVSERTLTEEVWKAAAASAWRHLPLATRAKLKGQLSAAHVSRTQWRDAVQAQCLATGIPGSSSGILAGSPLLSHTSDELRNTIQVASDAPEAKVAIIGPSASGKSLLAGQLVESVLDQLAPAPDARDESIQGERSLWMSWFVFPISWETWVDDQALARAAEDGDPSRAKKVIVAQNAWASMMELCAETLKPQLAWDTSFDGLVDKALLLAKSIVLQEDAESGKLPTSDGDDVSWDALVRWCTAAKEDMELSQSGFGAGWCPWVETYVIGAPKAWAGWFGKTRLLWVMDDLDSTKGVMFGGLDEPDKGEAIVSRASSVASLASITVVGGMARTSSAGSFVSAESRSSRLSRSSGSSRDSKASRGRGEELSGLLFSAFSGSQGTGVIATSRSTAALLPYMAGGSSTGPLRTIHSLTLLKPSAVSSSLPSSLRGTLSVSHQQFEQPLQLHWKQLGGCAAWVARWTRAVSELIRAQDTEAGQVAAAQALALIQVVTAVKSNPPVSDELLSESPLRADFVRDVE